MIAEPERYVRQFVEAGSDVVTVHVEAAAESAKVLDQIRAAGAGAGIALNPDTPLDALEGCYEYCDLVLVMSVPAGFGGQSFRPVALDKLRQLHETQSELLLEVDGGVNLKTIRSCADAGAQLFVVGSAIFRTASYTEAVKGLRTHLL
jgi:ribulose-phosphate 3-epimerase